MNCPSSGTDKAKNEDGAYTSFKDEMSYGDYLGMDKILGAQNPLSSAHDEMLFIIQHQTSELWMRLVLHELNAARANLAEGDFSPAFKMLSRVARIFDQLTSAWDVLRTMTPSEYTHFREDLGKSSGFQSHQYRLIEYSLGNRNLKMMAMHQHRPELIEMLERELAQPSIYQVALMALGKSRGVTFDPSVYVLNRPYVANDAVMAAWIRIYKDPKKHWHLYELAEKLVDLEDYFRRWRFNHVTTVERIIGLKRGTGGTVGVQYLRKMLEVELFPELWNLRGAL
ncbi:tryptophan 2,3-dioxygenase [Pacificimonas sp. WHA3]|uniref:Tryptophan 2,3-dioxygenase n=1 Tax=Pacificimonas pallii TaxID=2827236 RepID=A0ABS6SB75_9SPHN|nr:tryptophan 2,3-dioxygenase family protein [Pacificimonas pallii]MBV7255333.1 tryptophan 2,3-dioxygenase [Pacificimonas pallii]